MFYPENYEHEVVNQGSLWVLRFFLGFQHGYLFHKPTLGFLFLKTMRRFVKQIHMFQHVYSFHKPTLGMFLFLKPMHGFVNKYSCFTNPRWERFYFSNPCMDSSTNTHVSQTHAGNVSISQTHAWIRQQILMFHKPTLGTFLFLKPMCGFVKRIHMLKPKEKTQPTINPRFTTSC